MANYTASGLRALPLADLFDLELSTGHTVAALEQAHKWREADQADADYRLVRRIRREKNGSEVQG
ncbi:MAG TPA: hypothetical protein VIT65_10765 [Microlunatus sp.]